MRRLVRNVIIIIKVIVVIIKCRFERGILVINLRGGYLLKRVRGFLSKKIDEWGNNAESVLNEIA